MDNVVVKMAIGVGNLPTVAKYIKKAGIETIKTPFDMIEGGSLIKRVKSMAEGFQDFNNDGMCIGQLRECASRMLEVLNSVNEIVFVWWSKVGWTVDDECRKTLEIAQEKFSNSNVRLVLFENDIMLEGKSEQVHKISENIIRIRAALCPGDYAFDGDSRLNKKLFKKYI